METCAYDFAYCTCREVSTTSCFDGFEIMRYDWRRESRRRWKSRPQRGQEQAAASQSGLGRSPGSRQRAISISVMLAARMD